LMIRTLAAHPTLLPSAKTRRLAAAASALLLTVACGGDSTASTSVVVDTLPGGIVRTMSSAPIEAGRWSIELGREVAPPEDALGEILNPTTLALADDGTIITFEQSPSEARVYSRAGEYVRTIGGPGQGPGEFRVGMIALQGDTLVVQDPMNQRVSTWDWRAGTIVAERRSTCCYWAPIGVDGEGKVWIHSMGSPPDTTYRYSQTFLRTALTGEAIDTLYALERKDLPQNKPWELRDGDRMFMRMNVPLQPQAVFVPDPAGGLISGWTAEYSLRESRDGQDTVAIFGRSFTPVPVSSEERSRLVDRTVQGMLRGNQQFNEATYRQAFDPSAIPATRPAWEAISVDREGRRWVRQSTGDTTRVSFDLFARDGRWLDTIHVPSEVWPTRTAGRVSWARNEVAIIAEGDDGRPLIRVFRIRRQ
jgi:hypothetical protein